ncbi:MAG: hypothetical protein ACJAXR_001824 [Halopseudomonas sp.]|jgi:hypothetical protein
MKIISEQAWSYVLFDNGTHWILTFLLGGPVEIDVSVRLEDDEIMKIKQDGSFLSQLLEKFKANRSHYRDREVRPPVWP